LLSSLGRRGNRILITTAITKKGTRVTRLSPQRGPIKVNQRGGMTKVRRGELDSRRRILKRAEQKGGVSAQARLARSIVAATSD